MSSDSDESTPNRELERARVLKKKGNSIRSMGSSGSSGPKSIDLPLQGMVTPGAKDARGRLIMTNQENTSVLDMACVQEQLGNNNQNGVKVDSFWKACQEAQQKAESAHRGIKTFVWEHAFSKMKFILGPTCLEMGELPSRMVLTFLNCQGSREEKTAVWNVTKKFVCEGINERRSNCVAAMKKEFISKYIECWKRCVMDVFPISNSQCFVRRARS